MTPTSYECPGYDTKNASNITYLKPYSGMHNIHISLEYMINRITEVKLQH